MEIVIESEKVTIDGVVYILDKSSSELWGRKEIAKYLGFKRSNGTTETVNTANLYKDCERVRILFPNCQMELADHNAKPWTKRECIDWLNKPKPERRAIYKNLIHEKEISND